MVKVVTPPSPPHTSTSKEQDRGAKSQVQIDGRPGVRKPGGNFSADSRSAAFTPGSPGWVRRVRYRGVFVPESPGAAGPGRGDEGPSRECPLQNAGFPLRGSRARPYCRGPYRP